MRSILPRLAGLAALAALFLAACRPEPSTDLSWPQVGPPPYVSGVPTGRRLAFSVAADMRGYLGPTVGRPTHEFRDALHALHSLGADAEGLFMLGPGDIDPPDAVRAAIDDELGSGFPWFPAVGNHEAETPSDMAYLRAYALPAGVPGLSDFTFGPAGAENLMYSFDVGGAHFSVLDEYFDGSSDIRPGCVSGFAYDWLAADLTAAAARSPDYIFVVGHEPAFPMPDEATDRLRHRGESLDARPEEAALFLSLMKSFRVSAYLCGHTHDYSAALIDGLLQIDSGHARGTGDLGAPSTFLRFELYGNMAVCEAWRSTDGLAYALHGVVRIAPR